MTKGKRLFIGMFSNFREIQTAVNLGNVDSTEILFLLGIASRSFIVSVRYIFDRPPIETRDKS